VATKINGKPAMLAPTFANIPQGDAGAAAILG
jgi:hypothetical protein